jgi:hypothetical protein
MRSTTSNCLDAVQDVASEYAKVGCFKGVSLSIHAKARRKVVQVIMQRVTGKNIDRLALCMSSNLCEQYFSALVKFSQGKHLNLCQSDAWEVVQLFVAGLSSNPTFADCLLANMGRSDSIIRRSTTARMAHKKELDSKRNKGDKYLTQQQATKSMRLKRMEKESGSSATHRPDKLPPTDDGRSGQARKKKCEIACSNCGQKGHRKNMCTEPSYNSNDKVTTAK